MARYLWLCNPTRTTGYVLDRLDDRYRYENTVATVARVMVSKKRICMAFVSDIKTAYYAAEHELSEPGKLWTITACNKQYVTKVNELRHNNRNTYLGCLGNVSLREAEQWIALDHDNWYLKDRVNTRFWIPMFRNPNKLIPTGDVSGRVWPKQERSWPLKSASYEEWRDEIVNKMIKILDEAL